MILAQYKQLDLKFLQWELYQTNMIIYEADDMLSGMAEATNIDTLWLICKGV